jgi:ADP-ribose pyrophosphatase YjhB (NUDIX family)
VSREYPDYPRVGVGAVVLDGDRVLLIQRGGATLPGKWSVPGGLVELGETTREAVCREIAEECGLEIELVDVCGVLDRVVRDAEGRVRYHWVLVDFLAIARGGTLCAGDDAVDARWVTIDEVSTYDTTDGLMDMILRAVALRATRAPRGAGKGTRDP